MSHKREIIVIGAGVAGLAAATDLATAGVAVSILEARNRIGGRIFTQYDRVSNAPIELGAEFIHGLPPEIWQPLQNANVSITEVEGDNWCFTDGQLSRCRFFREVDKILKKMDSDSPDESFVEFLDRCCPASDNARQNEVRQRALNYVSGFNAADPKLVGVHWLVQGFQAEDRIDGERAFRPDHGYAELIETFRQRLDNANISIRTETIVDQIRWKPGSVEIAAHDPTGSCTFAAAKLCITLPLGVLRARGNEAGAVQFSPALPKQKLNAIEKLEMGKVIRIVLRFRNRFWDTISPSADEPATLSNMGFLFSQDEFFPTWWTTMPKKLPMITGWAPFRAGEQLSGQSRTFVVQRSLETLSRLLSVRTATLEEELDEAYFHDWQSDPYSRGAYSYGKVGADGAQQALAAPIGNTLFFAGEATDTTGSNGTVHGAIASGYRTAAEILRA